MMKKQPIRLCELITCVCIITTSRQELAACVCILVFMPAKVRNTSTGRCLTGYSHSSALRNITISIMLYLNITGPPL